MSLIKTTKIIKNFQQGDITVQALKGINISIEKGEFTAIVGPSGSGKTTLLNLIGALDTPTSGKIILDGQDISKLNKKELSNLRLQKLGFIFQAYNLIPVLTALENVEYVLLLQGIDKPQRRKRVIDLFKEMKISELKDRFPREMSGGQQQRVAVARALVSSPTLVLADEPTANLDGENAETLLDIMLQMSLNKKTTFLFSTHDSRVVRKAKRVIKLQDGKVLHS